jgi:hypothetical protein
LIIIFFCFFWLVFCSNLFSRRFFCQIQYLASGVQDGGSKSNEHNFGNSTFFSFFFCSDFLLRPAICPKVKICQINQKPKKWLWQNMTLGNFAGQYTLVSR